MIVNVPSKNGEVRSYNMKPKKAKETVQMIREAHKGQNMIIALEKGSVMELRNDKYDTAIEVLDAVKDWIKKGYKVYSVKNIMKV
ncbi:hypothetical protein A4S06_05330 [Erysipelotrichaceae bacterium MTC7]|nr:hypothetical protein A4S06_05330 [Erysipelotrichaceae bacterium MTC7]